MNPILEAMARLDLENPVVRKEMKALIEMFKNQTLESEDVQIVSEHCAELRSLVSSLAFSGGSDGEYLDLYACLLESNFLAEAIVETDILARGAFFRGMGEELNGEIRPEYEQEALFDEALKMFEAKEDALAFLYVTFALSLNLCRII